MPVPTQYTLHGQTLEVVPSARYLGVDIASDLSWKPHIARITNSANKSLGFLRRNLKAKSPKLREIAYKAIVHPPAGICCTSLGPSYPGRYPEDRDGPETGGSMGLV